MEIAFWISVVWIVYVFVGYPAFAFLLGIVLNRRVETGSDQPTVTVLVAAYNEAEHIEATVRNKLEQDYPAEQLRVVVVSDESNDGTDDIVNSIDDSRVTLIRQSPRQGKTAALNLAMSKIDSDIVVFSDANSIYASETVRKLVRNFASAEVGYVTGQMIYGRPENNAVGEGCSAYMRLENAVRASETLMGSVVGVDGGVDAVRRSAYCEMRPDQIPDFVLPLEVIRQKFRVVYEPEALLYEDSLQQGDAEFRMRVRVSLRAIWALKDFSALLNPIKYGLFSLQLWSHKVLRYLAVIPLLILPFVAWLLRDVHAIYMIAFWVQVTFYVLAITATWRKEPASVQSLPYYFTLLNMASGVALWKFIRGEKQVIWQPRQGS